MLFEGLLLKRSQFVFCCCSLGTKETLLKRLDFDIQTTENMIKDRQTSIASLEKSVEDAKKSAKRTAEIEKELTKCNSALEKTKKQHGSAEKQVR